MASAPGAEAFPVELLAFRFIAYCGYYQRLPAERGVVGWRMQVAWCCAGLGRDLKYYTQNDNAGEWT